MTPEQRYLFDINGYLHLPNAPNATHVKEDVVRHT